MYWLKDLEVHSVRSFRYSWICGHRWWCLEGVVCPLLDSALLLIILRRLHVVAWAHHVDNNVRKKDC